MSAVKNIFRLGSIGARSLMWCCDGGNNASVLCKFIRDTIEIRIVGINILEGEGISWAEPGEMFVEQKKPAF